MSASLAPIPARVQRQNLTSLRLSRLENSHVLLQEDAPLTSSYSPLYPGSTAPPSAEGFWVRGTYATPVWGNYALHELTLLS